MTVARPASTTSDRGGDDDDGDCSAAPPPSHRPTIVNRNDDHSNENNKGVYNDHHYYDVVIVGAGPSAIGLLFGFLRPPSNGDDEDNDDDGTNNDDGRGDPDPSSFTSPPSQTTTTTTTTRSWTVAVIERGTGPPHHPSSVRPPDWFVAAHGLHARRSAHGVPSSAVAAPSSSSPPPKSVRIYPSAPQRGLSDRIIDVPVGMGLGGTTNVNACLVVPPETEDFDKWPQRWVNHRRIKDGNGRSGSDGGNKDGDRVTIQDGVEAMLNEMRKNGALTDHDGEMQQGRWCRSGNEPRGGSSSSNSSGSSSFCGPSSILGVTTASARRQRRRRLDRDDDDDDAAEKEIIEEEVRVNYYDALLGPLFESRPDLRDRVTFLRGVEAQRILFDDCGNGDSGGGGRGGRRRLETPRAMGVECLCVTDNDETYDGNGCPPRRRRYFNVRARCEVILCGGAILSPALLLASGIGRYDDLREARIEPLIPPVPRKGEDEEVKRAIDQGLPVGRNLRDHVIVPRAFLTPRQQRYPLGGCSSTSNSYSSILRWFRADICKSAAAGEKPRKAEEVPTHRFQLVLTDGSLVPDTAPHLVASVLRRGRSHFFDATFRALRFSFSVVLSWTPIRYVAQRFTSTLLICLLNPSSTGTVRVMRRRTCDPKARTTGSSSSSSSTVTRLRDLLIEVDPGYLADELDVRAIAAGWGASDQVREAWFPSCVEVLPGLLYRGLTWLRRASTWWFRGGKDDVGEEKRCKGNKMGVAHDKLGWLQRYAAAFACPYYHWVGTCTMGERRVGGAEDEHVVCDQLRVRGILGLRICDASVFPTCTSGPTALTCVGLGYAAGVMLSRDGTHIIKT